MRVAFVTHGCRLNRADTDAMAGTLRADGHDVVADPGEADTIVINTCTITAEADADARAALRRAGREYPAARLVATGCWATAHPDQARALGAAAVLGNADKHRIDAATDSDFVAVSSVRRRDIPSLRAALPIDRSRALLKVQDGCNYRCAFCIVPHVRGPSRSLSVSDVVGQARALVGQGAAELVMTGVHLGTWGRDLRPRARLVDLVRAVTEHLGPARLRISSVDPHEVDDELLGLIADADGRICRHLHLPTQSLDDGVLRTMRRGHTAAQFADVVRRAVDTVEGIAIGTDVIAGFPTEDDAAFARTRDRLAALPLAYLHAFAFSAREGTPAADLPDLVGAAARKRRVAQLREVSDRHAEAFARRHAGAQLDVVTHRGVRRDGQRVGVSDNFLRLALAPQVRPAARVRVQVGASGREAVVVGPR